MKNIVPLVLGLGLWGYLVWWLYQGNRVQGRARAMLLTLVVLVLYALGVKF